MNLHEAIRSALKDLEWSSHTDRGVWVSTHCLYPSNAAVRVLVEGQGNEFVGSDQGGAVDEVESAGVSFSEAGKRLRSLVSRQGLLMINGAIVSPRVELAGLAAAILLVANISKEAAHWGMTHLRPAAAGTFREELDRIVRSFRGAEVDREVKFLGRSNKQHSFNYVLRPGGGRVILLDPVFNDHASISAKALAHLDVRNAGNDNITQRLVYDDRVPWDAANLNLLMIGAPIVPLSRLNETLERLAA